jgi:phosphoribosylcarboxyaminoimidazole (NCAIR) mutase
MEKPKVLVLLGSDSDIAVIEDGLAFLKKTGVSYAVESRPRTGIPRRR